MSYISFFLSLLYFFLKIKKENNKFLFFIRSHTAIRLITRAFHSETMLSATHRCNNWFHIWQQPNDAKIFTDAYRLQLNQPANTHSLFHAMFCYVILIYSNCVDGSGLAMRYFQTNYLFDTFKQTSSMSSYIVFFHEMSMYLRFAMNSIIEW